MSPSVSVCPSEVILLSLQHSKHLKQYVLSELPGRLSIKCVSRKFQQFFKKVLRVLAESFKNYQGSLKSVSKKFQ